MRGGLRTQCPPFLVALVTPAWLVWSPELSHPGGRAMQAQATGLEPVATAGVVTSSAAA